MSEARKGSRTPDEHSDEGGKKRRRIVPGQPWLPWQHDPDIDAVWAKNGEVRLIAQSERGRLWLSTVKTGVISRNTFDISLVVARQEAADLLDKVTAVGLTLRRPLAAASRPYRARL